MIGPRTISAKLRSAREQEMRMVTPALRITDYERSKAFYVNGLGFKIDGEHRFASNLPVFMTISLEGLFF